MIQEALQETNYFVQGAAFIGALVVLGGFVNRVIWALSWKLDQDMPPGPKRHRIKLSASWLLGPAFGVLFFWLGFLPVPGPALAGWVGAFVGGLFATLIAGAAHARGKKNKAAKRKLP